jgi:thioesterase domain-containing protein
MTLRLSQPSELFGAEGNADDARNGAGSEALRVVPVEGTLFLFPGGAGDPTELEALVVALGGSERAHTLIPDYGRDPVPSIEAIAERATCEIRGRQPTGPYLLGGYSFGGLIALEVARQLAAEGEQIRQLFLIDALYSERYWPRGVWLRALARRTRWHLSAISRMGPSAAASEIALRSKRLAGRLRARKSFPHRIERASSDPRTIQALAARAEYRPRHYAGTITLIAPLADDHSGCDAAQIWDDHADRIVVERVSGDHLTMMQEEGGPGAVASAIDRHLTPTPAPSGGLAPERGFERPLVLTTMRWFSAARLADALLQAGYTVSCCRPRRHPIDGIDGITPSHHLNRMWRRRSLLAAIRNARADIILPDDERSLTLLRRLHADIGPKNPELAALIAHSLGHDWATITSRAAFATDAQALGIDAPETRRITELDELVAWAAGRTYPLVLKSDGSWGGRGVAIVHDAAHLPRAWRKISGPPGLLRAIKRTIVNLEAGYLFAWIRRARTTVNVQEFVNGREVTVTAACLDGSVRALTCFEVVEVTEPRGPAAVVRVIDDPQMEETVRRLVDRYRLSGFCGFDFILTESGEAKLLEVNPRVTPTAHLLVEGRRDRGRIVTLCASKTGSAASSTTPLGKPTGG